MPTIHPTAAQMAVAGAPPERLIFLEGPAGTGKTTAGVQRLLGLIEAGVPASSILVLVPVRPLGEPYAAALRSRRMRAGGVPSILTAGGLARRQVELFWPLVAADAGFAEPDRPPTFLTLETAQYHMARLVRPLREEQGYFDAVTVDPNRLYSQVLDNLNKAAVVGFPHTEIGIRLQAAAAGEEAQGRVYADAQAAAALFREYCLAHNLLDFSLQVEVFRRHVWPRPACQEHVLRTYRHLVADNLEEDTPFAHDLLRDMVPRLDSALLIVDRDAGYRQFLGADPAGAYTLRQLAREEAAFEESFITPPELQALAATLAEALEQPAAPMPPVPAAAMRDALVFTEDLRFYPEMLDWVAEQVAGLVAGGTPPGEIVVLAPFLSDALRFSLANRLAAAGVPVRSHRPSRALRDEPATRALLTLAALAHPGWGAAPARFDVAYALVQAIAEMDPVRAQLLAQIVYRSREGAPALSTFEAIRPEMHERISYVLGGRYDTVRLWLAESMRRGEVPLDHFLSRLFGEVLSQGGYGFHADFDAANVAANLVESVQKFRRGAAAAGLLPAAGPLAEQERSLGQEYLAMVADGVIAAQYVRGWQETAARDDAVLLAPAYTFLMMNRPVDVQVWLDVGSRGWFERLYQPLTHPYVLSRHWDPGRPWDTADELAANQARLARLAVGLIRRCRRLIYLGLSELNEQGYEQRGPLLWAFNQVLQGLARAEAAQAQG